MSDADVIREAVRKALNELGVPDADYPAPVANAVAILRAALEGTDPEHLHKFGEHGTCVCGETPPFGAALEGTDQ